VKQNFNKKVILQLSERTDREMGSVCLTALQHRQAHPIGANLAFTPNYSGNVRMMKGLKCVNYYIVGLARVI